MVCDRCKMVVEAQLKALDLHPVSIELGVIEMAETELNDAQMDAARLSLLAVGFDLLEDRRSQLVEAIKTTIIDLVHHQNDEFKLKLSEYITQKLPYEYHYLSSLFSELEGITIEQYTIQQRIERVKELLAYGELTLSEIAFQLGYSSVAALSSQFKKTVGLTPSAWKKTDSNRRTLDQVGKT